MQATDIEKITKYIADNLESNLSLKDIAQYMNYSEFHLSRDFKKRTGYSIRQYIEAIKIEKSIVELMESKNSVTDIAYDSGHKSLGTFSNTFKKHTGVSPKKYNSQSKIAYRFLRSWVQKKNLLTYHDQFERTNNRISILIQYPEGYQPQITCVGLFRTAIPKEMPVVGIATAGNLEFVMENVPSGEYFLLACEIMEDLSLTKSYVLDDNFRANLQKPISFSGSSHLEHTLEMRRPKEGDPPITINLPVLLMESFNRNRNS